MKDVNQQHSGSGDNIGRDKNLFVNFPKWVIYCLLLFIVIACSYYILEFYKSKDIIINNKPSYTFIDVKNKEHIIHRFTGKTSLKSLGIQIDGIPTIIALFEKVDEEDYEITESLEFVKLQEIGGRWQVISKSETKVFWGATLHRDSMEVTLAELDNKPYVYFYREFFTGGSGGEWGTLYFILYDIFNDKIKGIIFDGYVPEEILEDQKLEGEYASLNQDSLGNNLPLGNFNGNKIELDFLIEKTSVNKNILTSREDDLDFSLLQNFRQKWLFDNNVGICAEVLSNRGISDKQEWFFENKERSCEIKFTYYDEEEFFEYPEDESDRFSIFIDPEIYIVVYDKIKHKYFCLYANNIDANRYDYLHVLEYSNGFIVYKAWNEIQDCFSIEYPSGKLRMLTESEFKFVQEHYEDNK